MWIDNEIILIQSIISIYFLITALPTSKNINYKFYLRTFGSINELLADEYSNFIYQRFKM